MSCWVRAGRLWINSGNVSRGSLTFRKTRSPGSRRAIGTNCAGRPPEPLGRGAGEVGSLLGSRRCRGEHELVLAEHDRRLKHGEDLRRETALWQVEHVGGASGVPLPKREGFGVGVRLTSDDHRPAAPG